MRVRRGFLLRLRALFLESGAESATAVAAEAHAGALAAHHEGKALLERRERALEEWEREHGLKPTRRPSDLAGADCERREELERARHEAHSDLQRTEAALERARREVASGGPGAGFSRTAADDAERAMSVLEQRLEGERGALERARERLWAFDAEHGVSSHPRRRVRDLSAGERRRREELRESVRDAKHAHARTPEASPLRPPLRSTQRPRSAASTIYPRRGRASSASSSSISSRRKGRKSDWRRISTRCRP